LQTQLVQVAETLLTYAFSPNYIRKLAGRGSLSVEPMALDKNRYSNWLTAGKTAYLQYVSYSILFRFPSQSLAILFGLKLFLKLL
jgi:hypothetical protein